ncbi:MAG: ABC transporter ATP-binding protein [Chloroflexota bacterium]
MIKTEKLTKVYNNVRVVDSLDLEVHQGEIFGFLGPNGAGKTTAVRILTTLTKPTSGNAWINGFEISGFPLEAKGEFGIVQQHLSLDPELTVWENMELHSRLRRIKPQQYRSHIAELLDYVGLTQQSNQTVRELSGGMKRRLMIARALIHRPKLLFLDEPTVGLDAQSRRRLWEFIRRINLDGTTVFLTTHYIEEAESLCHRVGVIHQGKLIALGSPQELCQQVGSVTVETLSDSSGVEYHYFPDKAVATEYVQALPENVETVTIRNSNLEDVFVELTGRKVGDEGL